jgi:hypothetical protein
MARSILFRRIVGVVAVTLAMGVVVGVASARTFDLNSNGSLVQHSDSAGSTRAGTARASGGSSIEWGYVAIGSSAAALALIAIGAVASGRGRLRKDAGSHVAVSAHD